MPGGGSSETKIQIQEADLFSIEPNASIALLGKRRTGKTTWAKYILYHLKPKINRYVALCGNKDNASEWKRTINPLYVMDKNIKFLEALRDYQDTKVSRYSQENMPIPKKYRICIVLDDCGSDKNFMFSRIMRDMLSNGRHYGMTIIILAQYLNQMHSENRDQIDYLGMLYTSNLRNLKKVQEEYVNVSDLRTFKCVLKACSSNRGMCWIDNTKNPEKIDDCVFFKRNDMEVIKNMGRVGSSDIQTYGEEHYFDPTQVNTMVANQVQSFMRRRDAQSSREQEAERENYDSQASSDDEVGYVESYGQHRFEQALSNSEALQLFKKNWVSKGHGFQNNSRFADNKGVITVTKTPFIPSAEKVPHMKTD